MTVGSLWSSGSLLNPLLIRTSTTLAPCLFTHTHPEISEKTIFHRKMQWIYLLFQLEKQSIRFDINANQQHVKMMQSLKLPWDNSAVMSEFNTVAQKLWKKTFNILNLQFAVLTQCHLIIIFSLNYCELFGQKCPNRSAGNNSFSHSYHNGCFPVNQPQTYLKSYFYSQDYWESGL